MCVCVCATSYLHRSWCRFTACLLSTLPIHLAHTPLGAEGAPFITVTFSLRPESPRIRGRVSCGPMLRVQYQPLNILQTQISLKFFHFHASLGGSLFISESERRELRRDRRPPKNKGSTGSPLVYGAHLGAVVYEVLRSSERKFQTTGSARSALFWASKKKKQPLH